jgi:hypothetical protein
VETTDLCTPIYLNTATVLDLLATFEDGFSTVKQISATVTENANKGTSFEGGIGIANLFGLLGLSLSGKKTGSNEEGTQQVVSSEKIHTPTSLFSRLRRRLLEEKLFHTFDNYIADEKPLATGEFLEVKAVLRKNPMVDLFEAFASLFELAAAFSDEPATETKANPGGGKKLKVTTKTESSSKIAVQVNAMLSALKSGESLDLIGEPVPHSMHRLVLTTQVGCFLNRDTNSILDGEFRVFGRVIRTIDKDASEQINLLRKTTFSRLQDGLITGLKESLAGAEAAGIKFPDVKVSIGGPAIQMIPIAIYA